MKNVLFFWLLSLTSLAQSVQIGGSTGSLYNGTIWTPTSTSSSSSGSSSTTAITNSYSYSITGSPYVPLVVITGESNAAGMGLNTDATTAELAVRPAVQIINNNTFQFQSLQIGVNNNLATNVLDGRHGFELELATKATANAFVSNPIYLVKAGQSGAHLSDWTVGSSYWNLLAARVDSAKAKIRAMGKVPLIYMVATIGINDYIASMAPTTYRTKLTGHIQDLRTKFGRTMPVIFPKFMSSYATYNSQLDSLAKYDAMFFTVSSVGAPVQSDGYHWTYAGYKLIADNLVTNFINVIGQNEQYAQTQLNYGAGAGTTTTTSGSSGTTSSGGSGTTTSGGSGTTSSGGSGTTASAWTQLVSTAVQSNGLQSGSYLNFTTSALPQGGLFSTTVAAGSAWSIIADFDDLNQGGLVFYLDSTSTDTYVVNNPQSYFAGVAMAGYVPYYWEGPFSNTHGLITVSNWPIQVKISHSGNDLTYSVKQSTDSSFPAPLHTSVGKLAGYNKLYIKVADFDNSAAHKIRITVQ